MELIKAPDFFFHCSQDKDANSKDNKKSFNVTVKFEADVEIIGYVIVFLWRDYRLIAAPRNLTYFKMIKSPRGKLGIHLATVLYSWECSLFMDSFSFGCEQQFTLEMRRLTCGNQAD